MMGCFSKKPTPTDSRRTVDDDYDMPDGHPTSYKVWIDGAENVHESMNIKMRSRGEHDNGYPAGLTVHWDSGWALKKGMFWNPFPALQAGIFGDIEPYAKQKAVQCLKSGVKNGYLYLVMDVLGRNYQSRPLTKWGYHAGKSYHPDLGYSLSKHLVGVEIKSPGKVKKQSNGKYKTWFGQEFEEKFVRYVEKEDNRESGYYVMFTKEQEESLVDLCCKLWMGSPVVDGKRVFKIKYIVGHDTISPGRKSDPGGSLSMTIKDLQNYVRKELLGKGFSENELE